MKDILDLIEQKKNKFAKLPFFEYLRDTSIHPRQRLVWSHCLAYFAMFFGELNNDFLRIEPAKNQLQKLINNHAIEDEQHWLWFLEDLEKLNFDPQIKFTDTLKFLWSKETKQTRDLSYEIMSLCNMYNDQVLRLAIIETLEATGNVTLSITTDVCRELEKENPGEYRYFGKHHVDFETGHLIGPDNVHHQIESIEITENQKQQAFLIVEKLFAAFHACTYEWMMYAQNHLLTETINSPHLPKTDVQFLGKEQQILNFVVHNKPKVEIIDVWQQSGRTKTCLEETLVTKE